MAAIAQRTDGPMPLSQVKSQRDTISSYYPDFESDLVEKHFELNQTFKYFGKQFNLEADDYSLLSEKELNYIFEGTDIVQNWNDFDDYYIGSGGIIRFTRIAKNSAGNQAVVEAFRLIDFQDGTRSLVYLEKVDEQWEIKGFLTTMVI